jgi:proton glutamate symport protein
MKQQEKQKGLAVGLLTSPWSILVALGIAAFVGIMFKDVAAALKPFGQMYLYLIEMTVIPIIVSAVISSVAGLAKSTGIREFLLRMIVVFLLMLLGTALIGTVGGIIGGPGTGLDEQTHRTLGAIVETGQSQYAPDLELSLSKPLERQKQETLIDFLVNMVPRNIFQALSSGSALALILFSIIFGVAIGVLGPKYGDSLIGIFDGFFKAFQKIIGWLMVALPFGLICLLADQIASTGFQILLAMVKFIVVFYAVGLFVVLLDVLIIWRRSHQRLGAVMKALVDPIVVSFVTRSSFAALPTAIRSLTQRLGFFERSTNLFFSLGVTIGRFGNIIYFAIASIFIAQLYGAQLQIGQLAMVVVGSLFAGVATAGASGIATLSLLSIVLGPLGLPLEAVMIIFIAIDTIADPLRTMLIILTNMAANSLIVPTVDTMNRRQKGSAERGAVPPRVDVGLLDRVREKRELVVAMEARDAPPVYYTAGDGSLRGVAVELAERLATSLGAKARFDRRAASAAELVTLCHGGEADLVVGFCGFNRVFENELAYTDPYLETREAILVNKTRLARLRAEKGDVLEGFRGLGGSVGAVRGSIHARTAGRLFPKAALVEFDGVGELADALFADTVAAALGNEIELRHMLQRRPTQASIISCLALSNLPVDLRLGIGTANGGALAAINAAVREAKELPWSELVVEKPAAGPKA